MKCLGFFNLLTVHCFYMYKRNDLTQYIVLYITILLLSILNLLGQGSIALKLILCLSKKKPNFDDLEMDELSR